MSKYAIILKSTKNEYQYNHQVKIMERHALLEAQLEKVQGMIADMEAECEARLKEQSVIHSMEIEQVKKETAQEIFSPIFAEWIKGVEKPLAATLDDFPYTIMPLTIKDAFAIGVKSFESNILSALDKKE